MAEEKYNMKNPAVKRILQEVKEMQNNPSDEYMSLPLEVLKSYCETVHIENVLVVTPNCNSGLRSLQHF